MELSLTSLFEKFTRNGMLIRVLAVSIMLLTAGCLTFNQEKIQKHQSITEIENNNTLNSNGMCVVAFKKKEKYEWSIIVRMDGSYAKKDSLSMKEEILEIFSRFPLCSMLYIHDPKSAFCECWSFDPDGLLTHFSSRLYIRNFKVLYSAKSIDALAARNREVHKKELLQNF